MKRITIASLYVFLTAVILTGCASIPPEAPELSVELGKRISAIENAHITLLNRFFNQKRSDVDAFIKDEWVPVFAEEVFSNPTVAEAWDIIVRENDPAKRLKFIVLLGPQLQGKINSKRVELIKPLDDLERRIEKTIRAEYNQARAMNNSITSFLLSASEVAENRNRYLEMAGVSDEKIGNLIDQTDSAVANFLSEAQGVQDKASKAEKYLEELRSILNSI